MDAPTVFRDVFTQCGILDALAVLAVIGMAWRLNRALKEKDELQKQARQDALDRVAADVANVRTFELAVARLEGLLGRHAGEDC